MEVETSFFRTGEEDWLSEPFIELTSNDPDPHFLFPTSGSDSSGLHSPIFTDVSDSTSENGLVLVRKRKAEVQHEKPRKEVERKKVKEKEVHDDQKREGSEESDPQSNDGEEVAQRSGRKGHKKSRQGCFNCKKRKIKCQETKPACENCSRKNIGCVYPPPRTLTALRVPTSYSPNPLASVNLSGTPTSFSMTDMRLFHHYMMEAYPHLPVGNDSAWLSQVPLIAHHNEYLMHALLGMAASHFELVTGENLSASALHHRILAIKGSNEAMSHPRRSGSEADALLASCYLLAFQSSYMKDGLQEFFRTIRGCSLVSEQLRAEKLPMSFYVSGKVHYNLMMERLVDLPVIHEELVEGAKNSLLAITTELDRPVNLSFYTSLLGVMEAATLSSVQVYFKWIKVYHFLLQLPNPDFDSFITSTNLIGRVLIAHFLAIQIVVAPIIDREWMGRTRSTPIRTNLDWILDICAMLPHEKKALVDWPREVAECVEEELLGVKRGVPKVSILRRREGFNGGVVLRQ